MTTRAPTSRALSTVLVANRGEIARRIVRACRAAGLRSVAVYSDADVAAPHVREADLAVRLGPTPAAESYLDAEAVVAAALACGADAVHPGYGFLSENAAFARAVRAAGLTFIGPTPEVMDLMGRKDRAREVAERAGVPVTPRHEPDAVPAGAYPVLVKAAAGGGGKGMHVVRRPEDLAGALATARREAAAAFGDDTLLVEAYLERGRHVEVQVFGDEHGNVVHLGERDCSAQRRHQKVVEEAPAPFLDAQVREVLLASSVALCREVGYTGAGTVEFLVSGPAGGQEAFFLEMNTRLQVEHPVTEEVTGLDLVAWQLLVAAGELLPLAQEDVVLRGHALEARLYAEDPYAGFLPQGGALEHVAWPAGVRVEAAVEEPGEVSTAYDPMLAKVVVRGHDREDARRRLVAALDATALVGVATNTGFVRRLVDSEAFAAGDVHTAWLDGEEAASLLRAPELPGEALAAAAAALLPASGPSPFGTADTWRGGADPAAPVVPVQDVDGGIHRVPVTPREQDDALVVPMLRGVVVVHEGQPWALDRPDPMRRAHRALAGQADVVAPMPGTVLAVDVAEGDVVTAGQRLGAMEAMKMELALLAPHDGTVTAVGAVPGDQVPLGHLLVRVEEPA